METLNNIASAAAEVVWPSTNADGTANTRTTQTQTGSGPRTTVYDDGTPSTSAPQLDNSQEPLSGVLGDTKRGEPYDAGNKAEQDAALAANRYSSSSFSGDNAAYSTSTGTGTGTGPRAYTGTNTGTNTDRIPAGASEAAGAAGLSSSKVPNTTVDDGSAGQANIDGPGTRPANDTVSEHSRVASGNDASSTASIASGHRGTGPGKGFGATADNASDKPQSESQGEGTGEKYIRSTGLKADGGDFDAAREGAGREADRLMEEKGVFVTKPSKAPDVAPEASQSGHAAKATAGTTPHANNTAMDHKEKKSLGDKIKEKLHHK